VLKNLKIDIAQLIFLQSLLATLGSLYFSEILKYPPCVLCWYQRIFMYPLVFISAISIWKKKNLPFLILPLSLVGTAIAFYHNLLYYNIIPESVAPCTLGISCTTKQIEMFGFLTIPLMSLIAFLLIDALAVAYYRLNKSR
jgi:disulfide bond formation protein DsbB